MRTERRSGERDALTPIDGEQTQVLGVEQERELLRALDDCKAKLAEALGRVPAANLSADGGDPHALAAALVTAGAGDGAAQARLGAVFRRYSELRSRLALANVRLVAHVAKRFRDRGVSYSDLLQEGFCGLLEAIDRFDLGHGTKLATYATWWIRQAMQRAVASGAYPVRLSPRHLRQLARNQDELDADPPSGPDAGARRASGASPEMIHCIHAATRPTVSLDATLDPETNFSLLQTMSDPEGDCTDDVDLGETVGLLLDVLRPRERQVLDLRFGLGGRPRLSLSQVGKVLAVSKERVRQIQDRALEKLRGAAADRDLADALASGL
jgi:RNA polymerase primary sigma factor